MTNDLSIVIVDDMNFSRALIDSMLRKAGYSDLRIARDGEDALALLTKRRADVVLLDWEMPKINGLQFTQTIRQQEFDSSWYTSIILITGSQSPDTLEQAFLAGVDDFIYKPFQSQELLGRVYAAGRIGRQQNLLMAQKDELRNNQKTQQELITRDALTMLFNRQQLRLQLDATLDQTYTRGGIACLALFDLDNLGRINENLGYDIGDLLLVELAKRLQKTLRPMDFLSRYWGGTFATLIYHPEDNVDYGLLLKRVLEEVQAFPFSTPQGPVSITCSAGAQAYKAHPTLLHANELELMALAHLNTAKKNGGNDYHIEIKTGSR